MKRCKISEKKNFYIPLYDWYRKVQKSADGEGTVYWNNEIAGMLHCNWINVFPSGKYRTRDEKAPGAFLLDIDRIIAYTAKSLEESHKQGIRVMTSAPIAEIFDNTWLDYGIDPDKMKTVGEAGTPIGPDKKGLSHACNNNDEWFRFMIGYTEKVAKAGFDGCLYDGYTYAYEPGYYCQCDYCKRKWKAFCTETVGREIPLPHAPADKSPYAAENEDFRLFMLWRIKTQSDFYNALRAAGRKYVPDFEVYINSTIYDIALTYFYLNGLDVTSSEFKHKLGHESSLFMYAMHEALTDKQLISFTNEFNKQYKCMNEYYAEIMTAFAAGGAMCEAEVSRNNPDMMFYVTDVTKRLGELLTEDIATFRYSGNFADTAILYSWRDESFFRIGGFDNFYRIGGTNVREKYDNCPARRNGVNLARKGIPFAYAIAEKHPTAKELSCRKAVIVPEIDLLDRDEEETLAGYVKYGGSLILQGKTFATARSLDANALKIEKREEDLLKKWTGTAYADAPDYAVYPMGKGKIIVCKDYVTDYAVELSSDLTDSMVAALTEAGVIDQVTIEKAPPMGYVQTALRANADAEKLYLHLINTDITDAYVPGSYTVSLAIPEGASVTGVTVNSPFCKDPAEIGMTWEVQDGRVVMSGIFNIYSYLAVSLKYDE